VAKDYEPYGPGSHGTSWERKKVKTLKESLEEGFTAIEEDFIIEAEQLDEAQLDENIENEHPDVRIAVAKHKKTHPDTLHTLSKDKDIDVRMAVAGNESTHKDTLHHLSKENSDVGGVVAMNASTHPDTLHTLSKHKDANFRAAVAANPAIHRETFNNLRKDESEYVRRSALQNSTHNSKVNESEEHDDEAEDKALIKKMVKKDCIKEDDKELDEAQLQELSKATLGSYISKAEKNKVKLKKIIAKKAKEHGTTVAGPMQKTGGELRGHMPWVTATEVDRRSIGNRSKGVESAIDRLASKPTISNKELKRQKRINAYAKEDTDTYKSFEYEITESYEALLKSTLSLSGYSNLAEANDAEKAGIIAFLEDAFDAKDYSVVLEDYMRQDVEDSIASHKKAGHKVSDPKYTKKDGKMYAQYTLTTPEGDKKTITYHGTKKRMENIAESKEELDEAVSRKDFQLAANSIREIKDPAKRREHAEMHANNFAKSNPRFDHAKFMAAAGCEK
jgi:hypothetical protein